MKEKIRHFASTGSEPTPLEEKNRKTAYQAALEGIVLLENDGVLPLMPGKIALYGAGAGMTIKGGTGSGEVNDRHAVTILEGLETAGFTVTTHAWIDKYARLYAEGEAAYGKEFRRTLLHMSPSRIFNLMSTPYRYPFGQPVTEEDIAASDTDTCLYVIARQAGEGADRKLANGDYHLSDEERANLTRCASAYAKTILVINVGSSFDLSFLNEIPGINAVFFYAQQGSMGGAAFADLLTGKVSPSGKLAATWAAHYDDIPFAREYSYLNGNLDEEYYREDIFVGYRYFDTFGKVPRYPFGYGLSYTDFTLRALSVARSRTTLSVQVSVTNTGSRCAGKEVVQLYVSCPQSAGLPKEFQRLAAFAKTEVLAPGASAELNLSFDVSALTSYRESDSVSVLEAGDYILRLGTSSRDTSVCGVLRLEQEIPVSFHQPVCTPCASFERLSAVPDPSHPEISPEVPILTLAPEDVAPVTYAYEQPAPVLSPEAEQLLAPLSSEELVRLTVGGGFSGRRYCEAPGTAGVTTGDLLSRGIPNVSLADGPAGVRLQRVSAQTKSGTVKPVEAYISLMKYLPGFLRRILFGNPKKDTLLYQYTTAFPVELALAQTWNRDLAEEVGRAVSAEMTAYGVSYWLAPAMNIQRNPLCGRNFEYFSEDPLLTGKMAAAVTRGIQSEGGNYATLKHFACNNQEENRNRTNANVSERALREIYLKGFEIAVRESRPGAVMSSYNKVNGVYTPNSYDLLTKVLRCEWGFEGLVMTDWLSTGKDLADEARALAAGNDLIMPGMNRSRKVILSALKGGTLSKEEVRLCASRVLQGICSSQIYPLWKKDCTRKNAGL